MPKHHVFLIHGMGKHESGEWHKAWITTLTELAQKYTRFKTTPLDRWVKFVPINYDDKIDERLNEWGSQAEAIAKHLGSGLSALESVFGWISEADDQDKSFFWSHVVDVILWYLFKLERASLQADVLLQVSKALDRMYKQIGTYSSSVIAHSLGTAVAHNTLNELATSPETQDAFGPNDHRWDNIFMLANVSRVIQTNPKVYESIVRPGADGSSARR